MSVFFTDSNSEIWWEIKEKLGIECIPMPYTLDGVEKDFDLGKTHDYKAFYDAIRHGSMPITSALNPDNYIEIFEPFLKAGEDILYVHFSSALSGTFEFMKKAIEELKIKYPKQKITTVDTKSISLGEALIVYEAAIKHKRGETDDNIVKFVESFREEVGVYFTVDNLMHLKRGGRLSSFKAVFGTMLGIKPILTVLKDGRLKDISTVSGRKKALLSLVDKLKEEGENVADYPICILHADAESDGLFVKEKVQEIVGKDAEIWFQNVGPTVGTHCGPGTVGLVFHKKK